MWEKYVMYSPYLYHQKKKTIHICITKCTQLDNSPKKKYTVGYANPFKSKHDNPVELIKLNPTPLFFIQKTLIHKLNNKKSNS